MRRVRVSVRRRVVSVASIAVLAAAGLAVAVATAGPAGADVSTGTGGQFVPVQGRILDTRSGTSVGGYTTPMPAGTWRTVQVTGALSGAIPSSGVAAVAVNFTAMNPSADGYLHADENESTPNSTVSYLHWNAGATQSNSGVVAVGADGKIQVQATSSTDLLIDVQGYYTAGDPAAGGFVPVTPNRLVDTRSGIGLPLAKLADGSTTAPITIAGLAGVPADASGVMLDFTVANQTATGHIRAYPADQPRPLDTLQFPASGGFDATSAAVALSQTDPTKGAIDVYTDVYDGGTIDLLVDVLGYFTAAQSGGAFTPAAARVYDSRWTGNTALAGGASRTIPIAGQAGVPATGIGAVALNIAVFNSGTSNGQLRAWPSDATTTSAANTAVDYPASDQASNMVTLALGTDGAITVQNMTTADTIDIAIFVEGWYSLAAPPLASLYYPASATGGNDPGVVTPVDQTTPNFSWSPSNNATSYWYQEDSAPATNIPATTTTLTWYPSDAGSHALSVWYVTAGGLTSPMATVRFTVAAQPPPSAPVFLQQHDLSTGSPILSGVAEAPGGDSVVVDYYLLDSTGQPVSETPYASEAVDSGMRSSLQIPEGALVAGDSYSWYMTACDNAACSAPSATETFVAGSGAQPSSQAASTVSTTIPSSAISAVSAPTGATSCSGNPCAPAQGTTMRVGGDGTNVWRSYLSINVSSIPADSRIVSATLQLGSPTVSGSGVNQVLGYGDAAKLTSTPNGQQLAAYVDDSPGAYMSASSTSLDITGMMQGWVSGDNSTTEVALVASPEASTSSLVYPSPTASANAPTITVTYEPNSAPSTPLDSESVSGDGGGVISWSPPSDLGSASSNNPTYNVSVSDALGTVVYSNSGFTGTAVEVPNLQNGASYNWSVAAVNAYGQSAVATGQLNPAPIAQSSEDVAAARTYASALAELNVPGATAVSAAANQPGAASVSARLSLDAANVLAARQYTALTGGDAVTSDTASVTNVVATPSPLDGGVDVYGLLTTVVTTAGDTANTDTTSSGVMYHFSSSGNLTAVYDDRSPQISGPTSAPGTAAEPGSSSSDGSLPFPASAQTSAPAEVETDVSYLESTESSVAPDVIAPDYTISLNQSGAVKWALQHYNEPYECPNNCTCFASQALSKGGGMPENRGYLLDGEPNFGDDHYWFERYTLLGGEEWSRSWSWAEDLKDFLNFNRGHWVANNPIHVGDIVFFKFSIGDGRGRVINHTAMVSRIDSDTTESYWNRVRLVESDANYRYRRLQDAYNSTRRNHPNAVIYIWRVDA